MTKVFSHMDRRLERVVINPRDRSAMTATSGAKAAKKSINRRTPVFARRFHLASLAL